MHLQMISSVGLQSITGGLGEEEKGLGTGGRIRWIGRVEVQ